MLTRRKWLQRFFLVIAGAVAVPRWLSAGTAVRTKWEDSTLLEELCDTILPTTDTPGAIAAGVPAYIRIYLADCANSSDRQTFRFGLEQVQDQCYYRFDKTFEQCDLEQRHAILRSMDGSRFFDLLKSVTRNGYFTSEVGCTQALRYEAVPGRWDADVLYRQGEKAWAT